MKSYFQSKRLTMANAVCLLAVTLLVLAAGATALLPAVQPSPQTVEAGSAAAGQSSLARAGGERTVRRAWERAQEAGVYHFATELAQTTYPAPAIANAGRSPQRNTLYLEGEVNLPQSTMRLGLWQDSNLATSPGAEVRVEGDRAYLRRSGGDWQEAQDFTGGFAPGNDPLAYLAGMKNVVELGTEARVLFIPAARVPTPAAEELATAPETSVVVTRYGFDLDGPAFAAYARDQLERQLAARGELPFGVTLDMAREFREMTGQGELWVDGQGLPLRLSVHLVYPQTAQGERLEADIKTDFSGFPALAVAATTSRQNPLAWASGSLRLRLPFADDWQKTGGMAGVAAVTLGLTLLIIVGRRSRRIYWAVALAVIFSLVAVPLLQDVRVLAFSERLAARQAQVQAVQQEEAAARDMAAELLESSWDAHLNPLADVAAAPPVQPAGAGLPALRRWATATPTPVADPCGQMTEADDDADGLNNHDECVLDTDPNVADSDADGLTDGQEVNRLGTNPLGKDTDGDGISDYVEVAGFDYAGKHWYTDPNNPDTNNDGLLDTVECRLLVGVSTVPTITTECDQDADGTPDLFDNDDDNDGVPDRVDISPNGVVGRAGKVATPTGISAFDGDHPLLLSVTGLTTTLPVFVDLQMRPQNADHLTYALNVLDWPSGDTDGQIQHFKNTTFATSDNLTVQNSADPANYNGDLRLIPMLEIQMDGTSVPLKLANLPVVTVMVGAGTAVSTTVTLRQSDLSSSRLDFVYATPGSYTVQLYRGTCPVSGSAQYTFTTTPNNNFVFVPENIVRLADGDHALRVTKGTTAACADLPNLLNGPYTYNLIDTSVLEPYGITVREVSTNTTTLLAYVPLNLVPDDTGGGRVAFSARMLYWPGTSTNNTWAQPQQFRVVWAVQMLTDECDPTEAPADQDMTDWCAQAAYRTADQLQIVQTYDESWYVTGLAVREDHGLDVAIAYENTGKLTADLENQDALWMLSLGLGSSFISQRDCGPEYDPDSGICVPDSKTDLAIFLNDPAGHPVANATIASFWDHADRNGDGQPDNQGASEEQRLKIPADELLVESYRYPHQDYHTYIAMTRTLTILQSFPVTATPTLLFAQAEHYRGAGLEAAQGTTGTLTVNLDPATYKEQTLTTLNWAPYHYITSTHSWEGYPANDYWDQLEIKLKARFLQLYPDDGQDAAVGRMVVARGYYMSLLQGVAGSYIEKPEKVIGHKDSPKDLINASKLLVGKGLGTATKLVIQNFVKASTAVYPFRIVEEIEGETVESVGEITEYHYTAASLGKAFKGYFAGPWTTMFNMHNVRGYAGMIGAGALLAGAAAAIALTFTALATPLHGAVHIAARVLLGLNVVLQSYALVGAIAARVAAKVGEFTQKMTEVVKNGLIKTMKMGTTKAGVIGVIIGIVATWAAFAVSWGVNGMSIGSMAWNQSFAGALGATIGIIVMFMILTALGPLGALLGAIMGLIDALVAMICNAFLTTTQQASTAGQWLCGGISGLVNKFIQWSLYSGTIMVDLNPKEKKGPPWYPRLQFGNFGNDLVDPDAGIVAGNRIKYGISVTNTIDLVPVPIQPQELIWSFQFNDGELRTSTFDYRWQTSQDAFHDGLSRKTITDSWQETGGERPFYAVTPVQSDGIALITTGINQTGTLYLSEAYAIPAQECWSILFEAVCYIRTEKATQHYDMGSDLKYDVLPATLDGFYSLVAKGGGYALAWGQSGEMTFPMLLDADGDGLAAATDPNDSRWDADGDTLRDGYEVSIGSNPSLPDSDGDGLADADEVRLGTNPALPDSDGDGLRDGDEVAGWPFVVAVKADGSVFKTLVRSDPLDVDEDGDGLTDFQEKTYGFNPQVPSEANVLTLKSEISEITASSAYTPTDNLVAPGATLHYTATVKNQLDNRYAEGLLSTESPGVLQNQGAPQSFVLYPEQQKVMAGNVSVSQTAASGVYSLTQVAGALITDWSELSGGATLWLPFDEPAGGTTWADRSGNHPPHDATCASVVGCTTVPTGGRYGGALDLSHGYVRSEIGISPQNYAVSFWFKNTGSQSSAGLFAEESGNIKGVGVYLSGGKVCAQVPTGTNSDRTAEIITGTRTLQDSNWHHVVHTYGSGVGQKLYVDGLLEASGNSAGTLPPQPNHWVTVDIGIGFSGLIDDLRLFDRLLTAADAEALANQPVLNVNFDSDSSWVDSSGFGAQVTCSSCPSHLADGVSGRAGWFNSTQNLVVTNTGSLDLRDSPFTLAAWVYPQTQGNADDNSPQGILGYNSGESDAYPTLQRYGDLIQFGFGAGGQFKSKLFTMGLARNAWNHVAVTFDPDTSIVKYYLNGILREEEATTFQGLRPASLPVGGTIGIGRTSTQARFTLQEVHITNDGDGTQDKGDLCMSFAATQIFSETVDAPMYFTPTVTTSFGGDAWLRVWEDDDPPRCGSDPNSKGDDVATITDQGVAYSSGEVFRTTDPGDGSARTLSYKASDDSEGTFKIAYANNSIPFYGGIDEVQIHKRALDEAEIMSLVWTGATALYLPLDEAPGATAFKEPGIRGRQAGCTACPTSGVWGRINQAAWFDGVDDYVNAGSTPDLKLSNSGTIAAWIYPTVNKNAPIVNREGEYEVYRFADGTIQWAFANTTPGWTMINTGYVAPLNSWTHIAVVYEAGVIRTYANGALVHTYNGAGTIGDVDTAHNELWVGGRAQVADRFAGLIDELWIFKVPLYEMGIKLLYSQALVMHLRFDEARGATQFANAAKAGSYATCSGTSCPLTGEGVTGQLGLAAQFDGQDDLVELPKSVELAPATFSVGAWVKPTDVKNTRQELISNWEGNNYNYRLSIEPGSLLVKFQGVCSSVPVTSSSPLVKDHWNHVMGTLAGDTLRLFINGALSASATVSGGACTDYAPVRIGGYDKTAATTFAGQLDEVVLYNHALMARQVHSLFVYQGGWVQDRESRNLTVDAEAPSAQLKVPGVPVGGSLYLANQSVQLLVTGSDLTTDVAAVQLGTQQYNGSLGWSTAPRCVDPTATAAWCPTFTPSTPSGEGRYRLSAKATDRVGNSFTSGAYLVFVDDTPPALTVSVAQNARVDATQDTAHWNRWLVPLAGTVSDPNLSSGDWGSGVPADGVRVTLRQPNGDVVGVAGQPASITSGAWTLNYVIEDARPTGAYTATVEAVDRIGQTTGLSAEQMGRHSVAIERQIAVHAQAPAAQTDRSQSPGGQSAGMQAAAAAATPLLQFDFEQTSATEGTVLTDSSGYGHNATLHTGAEDTANKAVIREPGNYALSLDGLDDYASISPDPTPNNAYGPLTVAAWIKPAVVSGIHRILSAAQVTTPTNGFGFGTSGSELRLSLFGVIDYDSAGAALQTNRWTHVAATMAVTSGTNRTTVRFYVDGNFVSERIFFTLPKPNTDDPLLIGATTWTGSFRTQEMFQGGIDAVHLYAAVLTDEEIHELYESRPPAPANTVQGLVTARPVPVEVNWATGANGGQEGLTIACTAPQTTTLYTAASGTFAASGSYAWEGSIHKDSTCQVTLVVTAGSGDMTGTVKVCGTQVATWSGGYANGHAVPFTATAGTCPANLSTAGIDAVDLAFTPNLPGSPFVNEAPASGLVLHLPFEDSPDQQGNLSFRDVSGQGHNASCSGQTCPSAGQAGHAGSAARFDGVDDYVDAGSQITLTNASFSTAFWAKQNATGTPQVVIGQGTGSTNRGLYIGFRSTNRFTCAFWGNDLDTSAAYTDTDWHHWACTYDAATQIRTIYRDGVQVAQDTASADYQGSGNLYAGKFPGISHFFNGLIDEVRVYTRTLATADVKTLYLGAGPLLELDFEKSLMTNATVLPDSSGWGHNGTLQTGSDALNKAVAGKIGTYALQFDGTDDYVSAGDLDEADGFGDFALTQWFSLDALGAASSAQDWATPVGKGAFSGDGWAVLVNRDSVNVGNHKINLYFNGAVVATIAAPSGGWQTGRWYHYTFTRSGNTLNGYLDGVEKASVSNSTVPTANSAAVLVGKNETRYFWQGKLDDVRIYPRVLSTAEVQILYQSGWQGAILTERGATVQVTKWQATVPDGLEGSYRLDLRPRDTAGHSEMVSERAALWSGSIDTLAPRLTLYRTAVGANYRYTTVATDFNLVTDGFASPCGSTGAATYFQSPWYVALASSSPKLYQLTADCTLAAGSATEQATACDSFGNCTTVGVTTASAQAAEGGPEPAAAAAVDELLARPEVQRWLALRTPELGRAAADQPPTISFVPTVLTATHYYEPSTVDVTGLITGSQGVTGVQVAIGAASGPAYLSIPAPDWPYTMTWRFPWRLGREPLPDGQAYTAIVTATDVTGQTFAVTGALLLDVVPPAPVTPTLSRGGAPVASGSTIRATIARLLLSWTPSSDGSGLGPYLVQWTTQITDAATTVVTPYDPAGPLAAPYTAVEAQRLTVQVASQDIHGNLRWQGMGPVYVDGPRTPDYVQFDSAGSGVYDGWLDSGCSLLGIDHRSEHALGGRGPQRFYATWNYETLRLAWTGANWNTDGDLFIYLDTGAGGTDSVFTPHPPAATGALASLPAGMGADNLIWVQDGRTATLLRWDAGSGAWVVAAPLSAEQYRFDLSRRGGQTDFYLPFELLGLSGPAAALGLLAFATEEPAPDVGLQLWATAPAFNPVNSRRANPLVVLAPEGMRFSLSHLYRWPSLGAGICPNGSDGSQPGAYFADSDPQVTISTAPAGGALGGMGGGLFWLNDPAAAQAEVLQLLKAAYPAVDDGQEILYTVRCRNRGTQTVPGVRLELAAYGALRLLDQAAELGDIPPGGEAVATFRAVVDRSQAEGSLAAVHGLFYDAAHGSGGPALGWLWAVHRVDAGAPDAMAIESPVEVVGPGQTLLTGYAHDESGVAQVQVEIQAPAGGTSLLACSVPRPEEGRWSCPWDVTASNGGVPPADGSQFTLRVQASDPFGHTAWSDPQTLIADTRPPTVTLNTTGIKVFPGGVVHSQAVLVGTADDEHGVAGVEVCVDDQCAAADLQSSGTGPARWSIRRRSDQQFDYVTRTISIYGTDTLGNRTPQPLSFTVYVDDVPPAITVSQAITAVLLGSNATVLSGTVSDGGAVTGMWVRTQAPDGETTSQAVAREGDTWWYDLPADTAGRYQLAVTAEDRAGNQGTAGPFMVDVTCTAAGPIVAALTAEPAATSPFSLTVTAVISNTGPETLPAGLPVGFFAGQRLLQTVVTTQALAPGAGQPISVIWAVEGSGDYEISVRPNNPPVEPGGAAPLTLCQTPATVQRVVAVRDVPLYAGWNLVSPPVSPFNTDIRVVQRPIGGAYRLILGYDRGLRTYDPAGPPAANTLSSVDAGLGYWIDALPGASPPPETEGEAPVATLRLAGAVPPEDQPLPLAAGWNLAGYLPRQTLAVTEALASIAGKYASVLGFAGTALSYYPDLGPAYNTLSEMTTDAGYWIRATQAITLQYPADVITPTVPIAPSDRPAQIRAAEQAAGVRPTYEWMNFYGRAALPDGAPAPTGTVVLAVDPQGVICGATVVVDAGHYGLLACYGDDPTTPGDEGARPGDTIRLFISSDGIHATQLIGTGIWTAHGGRQIVPAKLLYLPLIYR